MIDAGSSIAGNTLLLGFLVNRRQRGSPLAPGAGPLINKTPVKNTEMVHMDHAQAYLYGHSVSCNARFKSADKVPGDATREA
jgi:hypothetical protein